MTDFKAVLQALHGAEVDFIIVGAYAAVLHGFAGVTQDLDICYSRSSENLKRLAAAFKPFHPQLRGAPAGLPFNLDPETLRRGMNLLWLPISATLICWASSMVLDSFRTSPKGKLAPHL